jgi:hypothetical protein
MAATGVSPNSIFCPHSWTTSKPISTVTPKLLRAREKLAHAFDALHRRGIDGRSATAWLSP